MRVRLTQIDGKLPNLALMKLSAWHKSLGHNVTFTRRAARDASEPDYDAVYGSTIFTMSAPAVARFLRDWPNAMLGGTGTLSPTTVEDIIGDDSFNTYDYEPFPDFTPSIGFTQRGCRLKCRFCVVPWKEGKPRFENTLHDIWRGAPHPKKLHLLDNDFFGQESWRDRISEAIEGRFRVCLNQGINVRLINQEAADALSQVEYRNSAFDRRVLYTAWDNLKDEKVFFRGVDMLQKAGIPPKHLMVYMLVGFDPNETWDRIFYRFNRMVEMGMKPYPMVFDPSRKDLKAFQRWVVRGLYKHVAWEDYDVSVRTTPRRGGV